MSYTAAKEKYVEIAKAMKAYKDGMSIDEAADAAVEAVKALSIKVGIPQTLTELGITEKDIDIFITDEEEIAHQNRLTKEKKDKLIENYLLFHSLYLFLVYH